MGWRGCRDNASFRSWLRSLSGLRFPYFLIKLNVRPAWSDTRRDFFHFFLASHPFFFFFFGGMLLLEMRTGAPSVCWLCAEAAEYRNDIVFRCGRSWAFDLLWFICICDALCCRWMPFLFFLSLWYTKKKKKHTHARTHARQLQILGHSSSMGHRPLEVLE